jgi:hypothetical protein
MAGAALGQVASVAMGIIGLVSVVRASHARRVAKRLGKSASQTTPEPSTQNNTDGRAEMERRMATYLASRDSYK